MLTTCELLDAAKQAQGIRSEYRLARVLNIGDNALYNYRHGRTPDDERALRLAQLAGLSPPYVLNSLAAERAKDPDVKAAFIQAANALKPPTTTGGNTPPGSDGSGNLPTPSQGGQSGQNPDEHGALAALASSGPVIHRGNFVAHVPLAAAAPLGLLGAIVARRRRLSAGR